MAIPIKWDSLSLSRLEAIADTGDCDAQFALANRLIKRFHSKMGTPKDAIVAAQWYRRSAEQGHCNAQYRLGLAYAKGEGVIEDWREAARWYLKAANQGNAWAVHRLGECYRTGIGVIQDRAKATECFEKAAAQGIEVSQSALKILRTEDELLKADSGITIKDSPQESRPTLIPNSETGIFGISFDQKWWVASIPDLEQAAQNGIAEAQCELGRLYQTGSRGVSENAQIALKWYRQAAEQGSIEAQRRLGGMYVSGIAINQNLAEAGVWFRKAAQQGDAGAQAALEALGRRVARDAVQTKSLAEISSAVSPGNIPHPSIDSSPQQKNLTPPTISSSNEEVSSMATGKIFYIGITTIGIVLLILAKGNVFGALLFGLALVVCGGFLILGGEAIAEQIFGRHIGTAEKVTGVCIFIFLLFLLDRGCRNHAYDDSYDPTEYRLHP